MFDEFQTGRVSEERRRVIENLYDVFVNIRGEEAEHVKMMVACPAPDAQTTFNSPQCCEAEVMLTKSEAAFIPWR